MKNNWFLLIALMVSFFNAKAQLHSNLPGGRVGIGTNSASGKLHVQNSSGALLWLSNDASNYGYSGIDSWGLYIEQVSNTASKNKIRLQARKTPQSDYSVFYVNGENNTFNLMNGKTGIGTTTPTGLLEIRGPYTGHSQLIINTTQSNGELKFSDNGVTKGFVWFDKASDNMAFGRGGVVNSVFVKPNGQVTIGTTASSPHKLTVEGTIGGREVKVRTGSWSDFVFNEDYKLRSLENVEKFIKKHNHLPEIPSEKEVIENGINLGEMDAKLLQKIEELTLYMIEMNKKVEQLQSENNTLKKEISTLKGN